MGVSGLPWSASFTNLFSTWSTVTTLLASLKLLSGALGILRRAYGHLEATCLPFYLREFCLHPSPFPIGIGGAFAICLVCRGGTFWAQVSLWSEMLGAPTSMRKCLGTQRHHAPHQRSRAHENMMSLLRTRLSGLWVEVTVAGSLSHLLLWMGCGF